METPTNEEIAKVLVAILTDGFNRSIRALEQAGAVDTTKMRRDYHPNTRYYDLVTMEMEHTAKFGAMRIRSLLDNVAQGEPLQ